MINLDNKGTYDNQTQRLEILAREAKTLKFEKTLKDLKKDLKRLEIRLKVIV